MRGRRGTYIARQLLSLRDDTDGQMESRLETDALALFRDPRLPRPEVQYKVRTPRRSRRLDFAWPPSLVGVEAHSYKWHGDLDRWKQDIARDNELKLMGWTILHYTWDDVHFEPETIIRDVLQALRTGRVPFFSEWPTYTVRTSEKKVRTQPARGIEEGG